MSGYEAAPESSGRKRGRAREFAREGSLFQALRYWGRRERVGRAKMGAGGKKKEKEGRESL